VTTNPNKNGRASCRCRDELGVAGGVCTSCGESIPPIVRCRCGRAMQFCEECESVWCHQCHDGCRCGIEGASE